MRLKTKEPQILTASVVPFADKTSRAIDWSWVLSCTSQRWSSSLFLCEQVFNSAWLCWVTLEDHFFHVSVRCVNCLQIHWLKLQDGISVYSRYFEYYKSPLEQMHERCENYLPCDLLSDQVGFALAYNRFFGRYWAWEGLAWNTPNPTGERRLWLGRREGKHLDGISFCCLPNQLEHQGSIIPLVELPLTFFLSSIKSLFRHLCGILSFTRRLWLTSTWIPSTQ